ncbi:MAG: hypothetical protein AN487_02410 [Anabaena sp. CRKS33]|jgi:hypothetical protein|nr:MAG: hypothetical protein AN487_02410 [Anabaena sp. CRKS33]
MIEENVKILQCYNNQYVEGKILPLSQKHIEEIELSWKPELKNHDCWDKNLDFSKYLQEKTYLQFYVLEYKLVTQGIIGLHSGYCSRLELGENLVYVSILTVAPWNRIDINSLPKYKGIGTTLITFAIIFSMNLGFEGKIGLHSVKKAEEFYKKLGFIDLGNDINYKNFKYLELSADNAKLLVLNCLLVDNLSN